MGKLRAPLSIGMLVVNAVDLLGQLWPEARRPSRGR